MRSERNNLSRRDAGFTLTEMLIVMTIIGILVTTIAAVIIVVYRTSPASQTRTDDARSIQGLVTWLPQDVDAAPPDGFFTDPTDWPCSTPAPSSSHNVLTLRWNEETTTTAYYAVSYRYELGGEAWTMVRYECDPFAGVPTKVNLTAPLPDWSTDPTDVILCPVAIDSTAGGLCPSPHPVADTNPDPVLSVKLSVTLQNGVKSTIDAAPKNPDQDLADDPDAAFNAPPHIPNTAPTFHVQRGETKTIDLFAALANPLAPPPNDQIFDPDGDTSLLTVSIDPVEPEPDGDPANDFVVATTSYPLALELTAAVNAPLGNTANPLVMIISDADGGWDAVTANIVIDPAPNLPPQALDPTVDLYVPKASTRSINDLVNEFQIVDENPNALTFSVINPFFGVTTTGPGAAPGYQFDVRVTSTSTVVPTPAGTFLGTIEINVHDDVPANPPAIVFVNVFVTLPTAVNNPPTAAATDVPITIEAGQTLTVDTASSPPAGHGVTDDPSDTVTIDPTSIVAPAGITVTQTGPLTIDVEADATLPAGVMASPVELTVTDTAGSPLDLTVSLTVTLPPPPPTDCVLQTLTATPDPVDRETTTGNAAKHLAQNVTVTLTYSGSCDGLRLNYDSGHTSGLGTGVGRTFPPNSPSSITIVGATNGGTEKFTPAAHTLTASTTTPVAAPNPSSLTVDLDVN